MDLTHPRLIGFGISNKATFNTACPYADEAVIGSAFIGQLNKDASKEAIRQFVKSVKKLKPDFEESKRLMDKLEAIIGPNTS